MDRINTYCHGLPPTPAQITAARMASGLTQAECARLAGFAAQPRWAELEAGRMPMAPHRWRYFLHVAGLERLTYRAAAGADLGNRPG